MKEYVFSDLKKGQKAVIELELTKDVLDRYANISGDSSSIHASAEFAKRSGFKDRVVHGMLLGSIVSRLVGMELPGKYGLLHSITLNFHKPCYIGDKVVVESEISEMVEAVKTVVENVRISRRDGELLVSGKVQVGVAK